MGAFHNQLVPHAKHWLGFWRLSICFQICYIILEKQYCGSEKVYAVVRGKARDKLRATECPNCVDCGWFGGIRRFIETYLSLCEEWTSRGTYNALHLSSPFPRECSPILEHGLFIISAQSYSCTGLEIFLSYIPEPVYPTENRTLGYPISLPLLNGISAN